jgi:hypothetical protein
MLVESVVLMWHDCPGNVSNFTFSNVYVERLDAFNTKLVGLKIAANPWCVTH